MQVTGTARALVVVTVIGMAAGGIIGYSSVVAHSIGVLLWVGIESIWFRLLVSWQIRRMEIKRQVSDRSESVRTLWEGNTYSVDTRVRFASGFRAWGLRSVAIALTDIHPNTVAIKSGSCSTVRPSFSLRESSGNSQLDDSKLVGMQYRIETRELGVARFLGVRVRLVSMCGLFSFDTVLHRAEDYLVAPRVFQHGSAFPLVKQDNRLSPPGIHTFRRAGSGSELLEIREYMPGDPPKSIAWKLTARRDQLMSKQFECEVPLRCTIFMDTSASTYLRANGAPVIQSFARVAATLIEFLTASRDPVGVVTFDATSFQVHKHSATRRASLRLVRDITRRVSDVPKVDRAATSIAQLVQLGLSIAETHYPNLHRESHYGFGLQLLSGLRMRRTRLLRRYRMATILCACYNLGPHAVGELLHDDTALVGQLQKFLLDHQVGMGTSRAALDLENIADARKVTNLTKLLRHAIARSRDQERFVILADLLHVADHLSPLASVIRAAQAHGHRVSVVCAWDDDEQTNLVNTSSIADLPPATRKNARELFAATQATFLSLRFQQLQREMARAQVRVVGVHEKSVMQQILTQLRLARPGRVAT